MGPLLFVIFYNDLTDYITNAEVLQYADDTVLYFANSKVSLIEKALNDDLKQISTFCHDNELVLNLKKTKTEVRLYETTIRISKSEELRLLYRGERILQSSYYKYIGNIVNPAATMSDDFEAKYKKAPSRLEKLWKITGSLNVDAGIKNYEMMILPLLIYAFTLHLKLTDTQVR